MLPDTMVEQLQIHGPVLLHRASAQWFATWEVLVEVEGGAFEHWPAESGITTSAAIIKLWERFTANGPVLTFVRAASYKVKWNAQWLPIEFKEAVPTLLGEHDAPPR